MGVRLCHQHSIFPQPPSTLWAQRCLRPSFVDTTTTLTLATTSSLTFWFFIFKGLNGLYIWLTSMQWVLQTWVLTLGRKQYLDIYVVPAYSYLPCNLAGWLSDRKLYSLSCWPASDPLSAVWTRCHASPLFACGKHHLGLLFPSQYSFRLLGIKVCLCYLSMITVSHWPKLQMQMSLARLDLTDWQPVSRSLTSQIVFSFTDVPSSMPGGNLSILSIATMYVLPFNLPTVLLRHRVVERLRP